MKIDGKVVLITGASEGIGAECARVFSQRGAKISVVARSREKLEEVAGPDGVVTAGDLLDPDIRRAAIERTIERFGRIDILVNNAGAGLYAPSWRSPADAARRLFDLNFFVPLELAQLAVPHMRARGSGLIVNVSSIAGQVTLPWMTLYSASKFALNSLTEGLRRELRNDGIHAMAVCPGYVDTAFQSHVLAGTPPATIAGGRRFAITVAKCAQAIVNGVERDARTVVAPRIGWLFVALDRIAPWLLDAQLARLLREQEQQA